MLTLESGSKVLKSFWIPTKQGNTDFVFDITPEMAPNCYAYVTLIQPHAQTVNDLPIRLYGVIPILVEDPNTHLELTMIHEVMVLDHSGPDFAFITYSATLKH